MNPDKKRAHILTDISGTTLNAEDREVIQHPAIFGVLLFTRNYEVPDQLCQLTKQIHQANPNVVIAVDQEGGRVQRFREGFTDLKSMGYWGKVYDQNPHAAIDGLRQQTKTMVTELQRCGVHVSLAPVLDVNYGMSEVIGERSFHQNPTVISHLAKCVLDTMHKHKMPTIGKHFPGHGAVILDSHLALPIDKRSWDEIWEQDMKPYRDLLSHLDSIMPAHITYSEIDERPAGFSVQWMQEILRKKLNYQGLIISDDLSMLGAAEMGDYTERAHFALEAGCDILTNCNNREGLFQLLDNFKKYVNSSTQEKIKNYTSIFM